jgi:hypothetical protein
MANSHWGLREDWRTGSVIWCLGVQKLIVLRWRRNRSLTWDWRGWKRYQPHTQPGAVQGWLSKEHRGNAVPRREPSFSLQNKINEKRLRMLKILMMFNSEFQRSLTGKSLDHQGSENSVQKGLSAVWGHRENSSVWTSDKQWILYCICIHSSSPPPCSSFLFSNIH